MAKLKILYYNWIDFEDDEQRGGGVSIYQRNLVDAATAEGDEVFFLSSGVAYRPFTSTPFLRAVTASKEGVRKFEIVNSTILSPGQEAFGQDVRSSAPMDSLFEKYLREHGPFDVVHFNNLEGIPLSYLRLAREHSPRTKIIYSVHNYFAFCPQVNLWFQERANCTDYREGRKCVNCLMKPRHPRGARRLYQLEYALKKIGISPRSLIFRLLTWGIYGPVRSVYYALRSCYRGEAFVTEATRGRCGKQTVTKPTAILDPAEAASFVNRRRQFVDALNSYTDHVLAVSRRVAELCVGYGIDAEKLQTLYIGTRFAKQRAAAAEKRLPSNKVDSPNGRSKSILRLAYLGYMRRDKGFYFYLKALRRMPESLARRLDLTFATKKVDPHAYKRIQDMAHRFHSVTFYDGYTHAQLAEILADTDLGVVPVLWEDNLPQVAIECVASGVPILTSDRGGAQELLNCPELVFRAGSRTDFYAKLRAILQKPSILSQALAGQAQLYTPKEHYASLRTSCYLHEVIPTSQRASFRKEEVTVHP